MGWDLATIPSVLLSSPLQNDRTQRDRSSQLLSGTNFPYRTGSTDRSDQLNSVDNNGGEATLRRPEPPPTKPNVPFYGPGDVLLPPPEPAPSAPPKDFRSRLRDALSDENARYYLGPHLFDVLRKVHALTQLLPGSGTVQSTQDASRASEEAQAGNYGKAATHLGMGTLNAALDWLPPAKLAIVGGAMARTFPWDRLPTAMGMEAAGKSADNIWRETRLERDAAGNWTFEIPDKGYYVRPSADKQTISIAPLYEHHVHPGMQEAYPDLSRWRSQLIINPLEKPGGATNFTKRLLEVRAPNLEWARYVGIHELKHLIDKLEKHPPGGLPRQFLDRGLSEREAFEHYWRLVGEVAARNAQYRLHLSDRLRSLWPPQATERVPRSRQINLFDDDWR
jgi:hypothetical protein